MTAIKGLLLVILGVSLYAINKVLKRYRGHDRSRVDGQPSSTVEELGDDTGDDSDEDPPDFFQVMTDAHYDKMETFADSVRRSWQRIKALRGSEWVK